MYLKESPIFSPVLFHIKSSAKTVFIQLTLQCPPINLPHPPRGRDILPWSPIGHHWTSRLAPCSAWCCGYLGPPFLTPRVYKRKLLDLGALLTGPPRGCKAPCASDELVHRRSVLSLFPDHSLPEKSRMMGNQGNRGQTIYLETLSSLTC